MDWIRRGELFVATRRVCNSRRRTLAASAQSRRRRTRPAGKLSRACRATRASGRAQAWRKACGQLLSAPFRLRVDLACECCSAVAGSCSACLSPGAAAACGELLVLTSHTSPAAVANRQPVPGGGGRRRWWRPGSRAWSRSRSVCRGSGRRGPVPRQAVHRCRR